MSNKNLLNKLAALTASLTPGDKVSADDLHEVRCLLTRFLTEEEGEPCSVPLMEEEHELAAFTPELEELSEDVRQDLDAAVAEVGRLREAVAEGDQPVEELGVRVFRRELPIFTSQAAESMPRWASGRRVDRIIGPFFDELERPYWFDIFFPVQQVSMVRLPSSIPFLQIPLSGFALRSASRYKLPAGSIWILSTLLTPTAPAGAYTGLKIKGGNIVLSSRATVSHGMLLIPAGAEVTLKIELDSPSPGPSTMGPGVDASESEAHLPTTATFVFKLTGGEIMETADADARIYSNDFHMTKAAVAPTFEPLINRILVPLDTEGSIGIDSAKSQLFIPEGKTKVNGAAWALPVTVASPASLGEAAGAGALAIIAKSGLRATWRGLEGRPVRLGTIFMVEPGRLVVVSEQTVGPNSSQQLELWEESADSKRRSVVELSYERAFTLRFFSEQQSEREALLINGSMVASLDRPLCSDSLRLPVRNENATFSMFADTSGFSCLLVAPIASTSPPTVSLALSNALFKTTPPRGFLLYGRVNAIDPKSVENGATLLLFNVHLLVPFLPDPYAANIVIPRSEGIVAKLFDINPTVGVGTNMSATAASVLFAYTMWSKPEISRLFLRMTSVPNALPVNNASTAVPSHDLAQEDAANLSALRQLFDRTAGGGREHLKLLDVSTNADHLGVGFGVAPRQKIVGSATTILQIQGIDLVSAGRNIRVFTTPQIQWEPVITDPNPTGFPSPLYSAGDGGPTLIGANSVTLVPVAPRPLLSQIVTEFNQETGSVPTAALFTLPFGIVAAARLEKPSSVGDKGAHLELNQPETADSTFKGGLQLKVEAISPNVGPNDESPSLEGATVQTRNGIDPVTLTYLGKSVLSGLPSAAPGTSVEDIFNNEMKPGGDLPRVPVTRIDISGYGASTFSNWYNPKAAVAATSQVRFDVMVGRTAYEVVQVKSIIFPWAIPVVRTITIERRREGLVFRKDSGWVAIAEGRYSYPDPAPTVTEPIGWGNKVKTHPGVILAVHEARRIRETGRAYKKTIAGEDVVLAEVRFDADFEIEGVISGQNSDGWVPSRDQVGFVQTEPFGLPLYDVAFAQLLSDEGPLGGPVDCIIDVGKSGQTMRVARVDVGPAPSGTGGYEFAAAARGALDMSNDGAWSMLRHDFAEAEPKAVDLDSGTPLIREGEVGTPPKEYYRFADPEDLLTGSYPSAEYALMQSSSAHRILFPRPQIKVNQATITSTERAVLADPYAMTGAVGLFPERSRCFMSIDPFQLDVRNDGRYKLNPPTMGFPVPATQEQRDLANAAAFKIFTKYPVADPNLISFTLDPDAPKAWTMREQKLSIGMDLGPFEELMTVKGEFYIEAGGRPELREPELVYGPALGPVNAVIQLLTKIAKLLGVETPFGVSMTNPMPMMKASVEINVSLLAKKLGFPGIDDEGFFELYPQGVKIKGIIGAGMSNNPNALPAKLGVLPSSTASGSITGNPWHGYFYIKLGIKVPVITPFLAGGEAQFTLLGNELTGYAVEIRMVWDLYVGSKTIGVLKASAKIYFGLIIEAADNFFGIGILIGVSGTASVLKGLFAITVKFELIGLIEISGGKTEAVGQALVAAEITVCWFITISFSTSVEVREQISA